MSHGRGKDSALEAKLVIPENLKLPRRFSDNFCGINNESLLTKRTAVSARGKESESVDGWIAAIFALETGEVLLLFTHRQHTITTSFLRHG